MVNKCLDAKVKAGRLTQAQVTRIKGLIAQAEADLAGNPALAMHAVVAAQRAAQQATAAAKHKKWFAYRQMERVAFARRRVLEYGDDPLRGAESLLTRPTNDEQYTGHYNVENEHKNIAAQVQAVMAESLERYKPSLLKGLTGESRGAREIEISMELRGKDSGNPDAKLLVKSFQEANRFLVDRFRAAGGYLAVRADWHVPQSHDSAKVSAMGEAAWIAFVKPMLDRAKMVDNVTGQPLNDAELDKLLHHAWNNIATDGAWSMKIGQHRGKSALGNSRDAHRYLHFQPDKYLEYNAKLGGKSIYGTMLQHLDDMARDVAMMEVMGPNPDATIELVRGLVRKRIRDPNQGKAAEQKLQRLYDQQTGVAQLPGDKRLAERALWLRNLLTAAQLGGATLSSIVDIVPHMMTVRYNGLSPAKSVENYLRLILNSKTAQQDAVKIGIGNDAWFRSALGSTRYWDEIGATGWTARVADTVLRASLLNAHSEAGRSAFGVNFLMTLAERRKTPFDKLPKRFKRGLVRYGITDADWANIQATPTYQQAASFGGAAEMYALSDLARTDPHLARKLGQLIHTEGGFALVGTNLRTRRLLHGSTQAGTYAGEFIRSITMYKSFSATMYYTHLLRLATSVETSRAEKAGMWFSFTLAGTMMGAISVQLSEIAKGNDLRDMSDPKFWGDAFLKFGGFGFMGEVFSAMFQLGEGKSVETVTSGLLGPVVGLLTTGVRGVWNVGEAVVEGTLEEAIRTGASETFRTLNKLNPFSSLWYLRLAHARMFVDQMEQMLNPDAAERRLKALYRRQRKDGTSSWWEPYQALPERPPELAPFGAP